MCFLHQRAHALWKSIHRPATECNRGGHNKGLKWITLPLLPAHPHDPGAGALLTGRRMTRTSSRRDFLKNTGALIVGFSMRMSAQSTPNLTGLVDATQVDSWIAIG